MARTVLQGLGASPGVAVGRAFVVREVGVQRRTTRRGPRPRCARTGRRELGRAAEGLRNAGLADEAEILEANRLMAEDPSLAASVRELATRLAPAEALRAAAEGFAGVLAALPDPVLAGRASDVRELGRRAARIADGSAAQPLVDADSILLARDLGPAEIAELELGEGRIVAVALDRRARRRRTPRSSRARSACRWRSRSGAILPRSPTARCSSSTESRASSRSIQLARSSRWRRSPCARARAGAARSPACAGLPSETLDGRRDHAPLQCRFAGGDRRGTRRRGCRRRPPAHGARVPRGAGLAHRAAALCGAGAAARCAPRPRGDRSHARLRG